LKQDCWIQLEFDDSFWDAVHQGGFTVKWRNVDIETNKKKPKYVVRYLLILSHFIFSINKGNDCNKSPSEATETQQSKGTNNNSSLIVISDI
jgi:hypothetical protein